ncbi:MAG TPA: hypothetical protein VF463_21445 [Sphingobium sp.]
MYDYLDRPVATLDEGSRFLVWSMRAWTQSMAERRCPPSVLAPGFARSDLDAMLPHFHRAMTVLNREGLDRMGFGEMGCPFVSEAEAVLLATLSLYATDRVERAHGAVALLVREEGVAMLRRALTAIAILAYARFPLEAPLRRPDSGPNAGRINRIGGGVDGE